MMKFKFVDFITNLGARHPKGKLSQIFGLFLLKYDSSWSKTPQKFLIF